MTFQELHNLYNPPMKQETKNHIAAFFNGLSQVYTGVLSIGLTALFALPAGIFFAWFVGWIARILWTMVLIGWN